ncbi:hypothetical protein [Yinghuangia sp. YIM S09857]|uniref:hypothetical protein n=1 Tax=Yinghuangia sp. YIM S09857 TaxID=3436929 RepID=UPI003F5295AE
MIVARAAGEVAEKHGTLLGGQGRLHGGRLLALSGVPFGLRRAGMSVGAAGEAADPQPAGCPRRVACLRADSSRGVAHALRRQVIAPVAWLV